MKWNRKKVSIAILDMYEGQENQGMRCIKDIIKLWGEENNFTISTDEFEVRLKKEVPGTEYDIYISTGGPGSPLESEGSEWEKCYFKWLQQIENWNNSANNPQKKYVFFICHSFQLLCRHYKVGNVCKRKSTAFGVFPIHMMKDSTEEIVFEGLNNPFYSVDSRDYQLIDPDHKQLKKMGAKIIAIEKERPHVPFERAVMSIRFNEYFIGTQFHPEADAFGMSMYLQREDKKKMVIENYGEEKWKSMIEHLSDPGKIRWTYSHVLPNFLNHAIGEMITA